MRADLVASAHGGYASRSGIDGLRMKLRSGSCGGGTCPARPSSLSVGHSRWQPLRWRLAAAESVGEQDGAARGRGDVGLLAAQTRERTPYGRLALSDLQKYAQVDLRANAVDAFAQSTVV
jgi:hypothetical protein